MLFSSFGRLLQIFASVRYEDRVEVHNIVTINRNILEDLVESIVEDIKEGPQVSK